MLPVRFGMPKSSSSNPDRELRSSRRSSSPNAEPPAYRLTEDTILLNNGPQPESERQHQQGHSAYQAWIRQQWAEFKQQVPVDQRTEESFTAFLEASNQPVDPGPEASGTHDLMPMLREAGAEMETRQSPTGETQWIMAATDENIALIQRLLTERLDQTPRH